MDPSKKRKTEDNGLTTTTTPLTPSDARKILETLTKDQLLNILQPVLVRDTEVLDSVRAIADTDPTQRKLFIRGIGWETTSEKLRTVFSAYGELEEAIVITDKVTNKSKGYGFVTFKHIDGAMLAVKEPSKKIDGRVTVAQLAVNRELGSVDVSMRKIYVGNVPFEISSERLLAHFAAYGEIEEGPLGFDKQSGKAKGFAFFVYKSEEGARNSLVDPIKVIDGHQVNCKMATDGKKKVGGGVQGPSGDGGVPGAHGSMPGSMNTGYGGPPSYGGYSGGRPLPPHQNPPMNSSVPPAVGGGHGYGNQGPPSYGGGSGGGYGGSGYGSGAFSSGSHYGGGAPSGDYPGPGLSNYGSSMNRMPPSSGGGYPDGGSYGLSSGYPTQMHQPPPGPRGPPSQMYHGGPPYY